MGRKTVIEKENTVRALCISKDHYDKLIKIINRRKAFDPKVSFSKEVRRLMHNFIDTVKKEGSQTIGLKLMGYSPVPIDCITKNYRSSNALYSEFLEYSRSVGIDATELLRRLVAIEIGEFENEFTPYKLNKKLEHF